MLLRINSPIFRSAALRFSSAAAVVKVSEQKVKVGSYEINYVQSSVEGCNPKETLFCLPGALGERIIFSRL